MPEAKSSPRTSRGPSAESVNLDKQSLRNWYLLATITAVSTVSLIIALTPVIGESLAAFWPWANTGIVLMAGLAGMILILILHLTLQQLKVRDMKEEVHSFEELAIEQERRSASRLHALLNVTRMMGAVSDPDRLFDGITNTCLEIFDCQQASLMLLDPETQLLNMKAACGHKDLDALQDVQQPVGQGVAGFVAEHQEPLILGKRIFPAKYANLKMTASNLSAAMVVPIKVRDELVGVLNISSREHDTEYTMEDLRALEVFAENVGTCILQSERSEWMRKTIERQQKQLSSQR